MDLSIVIVNFNTKKLTAQCISSVFASTHCDFEIIVVDNSSKQEEKYSSDSPKVRVIHTENHGFGHACNVGMKTSRAEFFLMLNSDTIVHNDAIDVCLDYMKNHADVGAAGCRTLLPDGTLDHNCKRGLPTPSASFFYLVGLDKIFPKSKTLARYHATFLDNNAISEVEALSGAFMMLRREAVGQVGMFDEKFFMYCEDIDLCYRIGQAGWKLVYIPHGSITHFKGQSGLSASNPFVIRQFYRSMKIFYRKNFAGKYNFLVTACVYLGISLQTVLALAKAKKKGCKT